MYIHLSYYVQYQFYMQNDNFTNIDILRYYIQNKTYVFNYLQPNTSNNHAIVLLHTINPSFVEIAGIYFKKIIIHYLRYFLKLLNIN